MLPCHGCGYRREIPGDSHLRCAYRWDLEPDKLGAFLKAGLADALNDRKTGRWFRWPFNFDPTWGPDACPARAEQTDPAMALEDNPRTHLLSFLARRL